MRPGDVVFVRGKGSISKIIRWFDKGEFTHVAIAISDTRVIEAQRFVKTQVVEMNYEDYEVLDLHLFPEQRARCIVEAYKFTGTRYDYPQIAWYMVKKVFRIKGSYPANNPNTLICSELVSRVLFATGLVEESDTLYELTPNQLYDTLQYIAQNRRPL